MFDCVLDIPLLNFLFNFQFGVDDARTKESSEALKTILNQAVMLQKTVSEIQKQNHPLEVFFKKAVFKIFATCAEKHQCWSLFFSFQYPKNTKTQLLSSEYFKSTYFEEHLRMTGSVLGQVTILLENNGFYNMYTHFSWALQILIYIWLCRCFPTRTCHSSAFLRISAFLDEVLRKLFSIVSNSFMSCENC